MSSRTLPRSFPKKELLMSYKPLYHIFSDGAFLNDPNGLLYENGQYHVFYQWNPSYPGGKRVGWAHRCSTDLIHWTELPPALLPDNWYDRCGCYSGSAVMKDGKIHLLYTGNVRDDGCERETYQCLAASDDGEHFTKYAGNPLLSGPAAGYTAHFRDPKVFADQNGYAFVLGAQTTDEHGRALLYRSPDLLSWKLDGALQFDDPELDDFGYMWECPNLFELPDAATLQKHAVLLFCPQGLKPWGMRFRNRYQCGYIVAPRTFNGTGAFIGGSAFEEIDRGFEFYAPQIFSAGKRTLMIGWMGMPEEEDQPSAQENWMHCLTVPRTVWMENRKLFQWPVEELDGLHGEKQSISLLPLENEAAKLPDFSGACYDMRLTFDTTRAQSLTLSLRQSEQQEIRITFADSVLRIDRSRSAYAPGDPVREVCLRHPEKLDLRILSDRSAMEIYVNGGEEVFSLRCYLEEDAVHTHVGIQGKAVLTKGEFYPMHA